MPNFEVKRAVCKPECVSVSISGTSRRLTLARLFSRFCGFLDQRQFIKRIDLNGVDLGVDRVFDLPDLFARAVKDDLVAAKADL